MHPLYLLTHDILTKLTVSTKDQTACFVYSDLDLHLLHRESIYMLLKELKPKIPKIFIACFLTLTHSKQISIFQWLGLQHVNLGCILRAMTSHSWFFDKN